MRNALFTLALLASALTLPLTARADTIDDFVLTGDGHTITYSLPASTSFPDHPNFDFLAVTAPTTIDGVTGVQAGDYYSPSFPWVSLILAVPPATFGTSQLYLSGPMLINFDFVPASNPLPYLQFDGVPTFIPGTYTLHQEKVFSCLSRPPSSTPSPSHPRPHPPPRPSHPVWPCSSPASSASSPSLPDTDGPITSSTKSRTPKTVLQSQRIFGQRQYPCRSSVLIKTPSLDKSPAGTASPSPAKTPCAPEVQT